ncbi:hypothetical protein [Acinetobacter sp. Marseille-Q1618]|uniref:hypothetical protein n=1 Tax=Acinetobacter sp. Marseille-Q1618 TaxID=2697502 RepID=UPI00156EEE8C|nr:hypothetical protein [Acinetobacter sp. Marseille-Q1618]
MFEVLHTVEDFKQLVRAEDFVLIRGINSSLILGQVSIDTTCIYLSLTDLELSRTVPHPKLLVMRIGSLNETLKRFPNYFNSISTFIEKSSDSNFNKYKLDSLFTFKALFHLIKITNDENNFEEHEVTPNKIKQAIELAVEEEILISDMNYMLSQYIFNRPRQEMEISE